MADIHQMRRAQGRRFAPLIAALIFLYLLLGVGSRLIVDALWFGELGYVDVFRTRILSQLVLGVLGLGVAFAVLAWTLRAALRRSPALRLGTGGDIDLAALQLERRLPLITTLGAAVLSLGLAATLSQEWMTLQAFLHRVPYGQVEPIFGRDIGFYLFTLPALRLVHGWLLVLMLLALFGTLGVYGLRGGLVDRRGILPAARRHLGVLAIVFLLLLAVHFALSQFEVLFSSQGVVYGAGYTDVKAGLPGLRVLIGVGLVAAGVLAYGVARGRLRWIAAAPAFLVAVYVFAVVLIPGGVQRLVVEPNELDKERLYIENALRLTREAYDLEDVEERVFQVAESTDPDILRTHVTTIENIRLWDWRPLLTTYQQIQAIRPYYNFGDVDVDRYVIDGRYRQVMLSARELAYDKLHQDARTWVNLHLKYTHGYGVCMSPVNEISPEGLPELLIRDIPPSSEVFEVTRPEIYYGEQTTEFSLVRTKEEEFDYPIGETIQPTRYGGEGGISVGSFLRRALFAWHLRSRELLFTNSLTSESRILMHRTLSERLRRVAPFLRYDRDPYLVLHEGRMVWIVDAYTVSRRFPYSQPSRDINYIRNAVKVVVDAYQGTAHFYVADAEDPIIQVYRSIFPTLFRALDEMPESLRAHLRYPVDLFRIQAETYATFHMNEPRVFYNREDLWQLPIESFEGREIVMEPYYTIMRLPDSDRAEMILMLPFTPSRKDNMIAWMAARCDGDNLGRRMVFLFSKQELIYGPRQIEARIDQDTDISQQLTLWSQRGSSVSRGNLLVIPLGESILYVEPLYLSAEKGALPELKRVIAAHENNIEMEIDLESALGQLFGERVVFGQRRAAPTETPQGTEPAWPADAAGVIAREALDILREADAALQRGDWSRYGDAMRRLRAHLEAQAEPPSR
jgi:uncharacterized membrane protein (UPF0182 family)